MAATRTRDPYQCARSDGRWFGADPLHSWVPAGNNIFGARPHKNMPDSWAQPTVGGDGTVYAAYQSGFAYAIDGQTGKLLSKFDAHEGIQAQVVIGRDGAVLVVAGRHTYCFKDGAKPAPLPPRQPQIEDPGLSGKFFVVLVSFFGDVFAGLGLTGGRMLLAAAVGVIARMAYHHYGFTSPDAQPGLPPGPALQLISGELTSEQAPVRA
jgi:hypothetical protein